MVARAYGVIGVVSALASAACGAVPLVAGGERAEGAFERTLSVVDAVSLDISTGSGRIVVRAGSPGRVVIEGRIQASDGGLFDDGLFGRSRLSPRDRVSRLVQNPPIRQSGDDIRIGRIEDDELRQRVGISYTITVPARATVIARTGSGSQEIVGVDGPVDVSAGSGSIRVRETGSRVRAATGSGSITADQVGALDAQTGSGSIEGTAVGGAITAKTGSGRIRLVQRGVGDVNVSAGSGSIDVTGARGAVKASTGSGSLTVRGEPSAAWDLRTSSGSVAVDLEGSPAFDLEATGGRVDSQFPIAVVEQTGRRSLRGAVNGGGPLVRVHTSSGHISIR